MEYASIIAAGVSFVASGIVGLIAWGLRGELNTVRGEIKTLRAEQTLGLAKADNSGEIRTVRAEINTLRAEHTAALAAAELRFFDRVNGKYVQKGIHDDVVARIDRIENRVENLE